jgi:hypothetical protein
MHIVSGTGMVALLTVNYLLVVGLVLCLVLLTRSILYFLPPFRIFGPPFLVKPIGLLAVCGSPDAVVFRAPDFHRLSFTTLGVVAAILEICLLAVGAIAVQ